MADITSFVTRLWIRVTARKGRDEEQRGAGLVEYAMLMALIVLVCISALTFFGETTSAKFSVNASCFESECH